MIELELLGRQGCHLCDALHAELVAALPASGVRIVVRAVDSDPELARRYGRQVPVVRLGGAVLLAHRFDAERLARALAGEAWEPLELR